jgi:hypothetical protein
MNRTQLFRWFDRGPRKGWHAAPPVLRLEALEDRNLLSAGLGLLGHAEHATALLDSPAPRQLEGGLLITVEATAAPLRSVTVSVVPALLSDVVPVFNSTITFVDRAVSRVVDTLVLVSPVLESVVLLPAGMTTPSLPTTPATVTDVPTAPVAVKDLPATVPSPPAAPPATTQNTVVPTTLPAVGVEAGGRGASAAPAPQSSPAVAPAVAPAAASAASAVLAASSGAALVVPRDSVAVQAAEPAVRTAALPLNASVVPVTAAPASTAHDAPAPAQAVETVPADAAPASPAAPLVTPSDAEDPGTPGDAVLPAELGVAAEEPPSSGAGNETTLLEQVGASPASCVADEVFMRVAYWTGQDSAGDPTALEPGVRHWTLWLAPAVAAAGLYFANRRYRQARPDRSRTAALVLLR